MLLFFAALTWGLIELLFYLTHQRPMTEAEINLLAIKRKRRYIMRTFRFPQAECSVDKSFKSSMSPYGKWYFQSVGIHNFPSYVSALLKGKKHEWVVIGLVKDERIICFWANKGHDNRSVYFTCEIDELLSLCRQFGCHSVIRLHNHPNSNPQYYNCLLASDQDRASAKSLAQEMNARGLNWFDFVCERGRFVEYFRSFSTGFMPLCAKPNTIRSKNNISATGNYKLHRELGIFRKW